jgi:adenine deaminase
MHQTENLQLDLKEDVAIMNRKQLKAKIFAANKQTEADLVIRNAKIVNVFTKELSEGDIAIMDGVIVGIGEYEGKEEIDAEGRYICPGLIDAHVHIESSMVTPHQFSQVVLPHGVTTVITDPHEIANVCGSEGIDYMLNDSEQTMLEVIVMLPSCVPATSFENSGAKLESEDLRPFISHKRVRGLAEVMDFPSVLQGTDGMLDKLLLSRQIDGHAAGLKENDINVYRAAGILTDHECVTKEELLQRLERGMYVMLREGSVAKNLSALLEGVNENNAHRCLFCTDDKHLDDLIEEGSIDYNVRVAIQHGLNPITAISMASFYAAQCYGLHTKGAIAPGYDADFILLDDLEDFTIYEVYKKGKLAAANGRYAGPSFQRASSDKMRDTVNVSPYAEHDLRIPLGKNAKANIIGINPNSLITNHLTERADTSEDGCFLPNTEKDLLKIVVMERHRATGNIGLGVVKGLGLKSGAIATTIAHDSHNVIAVGTNDEDISAAIESLKRMGGGLALAKEGKVLAELPLAVAGLMSEKNHEEVYEEIKHIDAGLSQLGAPADFNAFLTLSFLSLPVIPHLKLTDRGLFDMSAFRHIAVPVDES